MYGVVSNGVVVVIIIHSVIIFFVYLFCVCCCCMLYVVALVVVHCFASSKSSQTKLPNAIPSPDLSVLEAHVFLVYL